MQRSDREEEKALKEKLSDIEWRLNNLYSISDAAGHCIPFRLNWAQNSFFKRMHYFNIILKARQLGFSTFILIYMLDAALFHNNHACGVIAQGLTEAADLFDNKIRFAYDNLPEWLKERRQLTADSARKLEFNNGSSITVGTSLRGGTHQKLHISEYGKIAARYPEKAREIKTGAINTVHSGQQLFIESTAEGMGGEFFDIVKLARKLRQENRELSPLDPKFHFYPWYQHPDYQLDKIDQSMTIITKEDTAYFNSLKVNLSLAQKCWYVKKAAIMGDDMKREFPSNPNEAFSASIEGAYYSKQMSFVRKNGQICRVQYDHRELVHTFWDIGNFAHMPVWFFQHVGRELRFIDFLQHPDADLTYIAAYFRNSDYSFGKHYLPHDGTTKQLGLKNQSVKEMLEGLGVRNIQIVPRTNDVARDIETRCKPILQRCWFDEEKCKQGIVALDNYRKEWDDRLGVWKDKARGDIYSHGADAFRTFAVGYTPTSDEIRNDMDDFDDLDGTGVDNRNSISGY